MSNPEKLYFAIAVFFSDAKYKKIIVPIGRFNNSLKHLATESSRLNLRAGNALHYCK